MNKGRTRLKTRVFKNRRADVLSDIPVPFSVAVDCNAVRAHLDMPVAPGSFGALSSKPHYAVWV